VATGLAYTPTGGEVLFIEATDMPGSKKFTLTGSLGQVMKESAQAALSYVKSISEDLKIPTEYWEKNDIHVHVPAGAQPKDGPSAGVTIAVAIASLATDRPIRYDVGMTGEVTLRGKLLPIGGVKEKVLAAHRAGLKTVLLPQRNEMDLEDVPEEVRETTNFVFADDISDAIRVALENSDRTRKRKTKAASKKKDRTDSKTKKRESQRKKEKASVKSEAAGK
jgi:ATP-dependent Lon protease